MHPRRFSFVLAPLLAASCNTAPLEVPATTNSVAWRDWDASAFATARAEGRLVLLDLGATWCHWCHVMEHTTYADAGVQALLQKHFVAVAVDADRRLDLATRYQDWGWPATIVFDANGNELWKNRGYVPPDRMRTVLQQMVDDPVPLAASDAGATTSVAGAAAVAAPTQRALLDRMEALWDEQNAGFGFVHKYVDAASVESLVGAARRGDATARARALRTLDAERALLDPTWGGAYQYSHGGVWTNPHFEKVMSRQLADLRAFSIAFAAFGRADDLAAAQNVARFLTTMLASPEGAFYASQDADLIRGQHAAEYFARDDAGRRELGVPHVETSLWSRENGQAIQGLCALLAVDRDETTLRRTLAAAEWIVAHRRRADGTFAHGDDDRGGPFLADSLEMTAAFAALFEVTADPKWIDLARASVTAIDGAFATANGYATAVADGILPPTVDRTENVLLARTAQRLAALTGDETIRAVADRAFGFVASDAVALEPGLPADLLLAIGERTSEPVHVVIVGDPAARATSDLWTAALRNAPSWRLVERVRPGASTLHGDDYPADDAPTAFVCRDGACSAPIVDPIALGALLAGN